MRACLALLRLFAILSDASNPAPVFEYSGSSTAGYNVSGTATFVPNSCGTPGAATSLRLGAHLTHSGSAIVGGFSDRTSTVWLACSAQPDPIRYHAIFLYGDDTVSTGGSFFSISVIDGALAWDGWKIGCISNTIVPCDGQWHHVAAAYAFPTVNLYFDAELVCSSNVGFLSVPRSPSVFLGWGGDATLVGGEPWAGSLARARVFSSALTATQVTADMAGGGCPTASASQLPTPRLPAFIPRPVFEYAGSAESTAGYTVSGSVTFIPDSCGKPGAATSLQPGASLSFTGDTSNIPGGDAEKSASAWMACASQPSAASVHTVFLFGNTSTGSRSFFSIMVYSSGILVWDGYNIRCSSTVHPCDGRWHHVAATYASPTVRVYFDANLVCASSPGPLVVPRDPPVYIGWLGDSSIVNGGPWAGSLAHACVFASALTPAQVAADMAGGGCVNGSPLPSPTPSPTPSPPWRPRDDTPGTGSSSISNTIALAVVVPFCVIVCVIGLGYFWCCKLPDCACCVDDRDPPRRVEARAAPPPAAARISAMARARPRPLSSVPVPSASVGGGVVGSVAIPPLANPSIRWQVHDSRLLLRTPPSSPPPTPPLPQRTVPGIATLAATLVADAAARNAPVVPRNLVEVRGNPRPPSQPALPPLDEPPDEVAEGGRDEPCCVCLEHRRVVVLVPCGHLCLCGGCATALRRRAAAAPSAPSRCPQCRTNIHWLSCIRIRGPRLDADLFGEHA